MLDLWFVLMTPGSFLLGSWSIYWARGQDQPQRIVWGHCLFVFTLVLLGLSSLIAALAHAPGLAPLGLIAGLLVVGMLWENRVTEA